MVRLWIVLSVQSDPNRQRRIASWFCVAGQPSSNDLLLSGLRLAFARFTGAVAIGAGPVFLEEVGCSDGGASLDLQTAALNRPSQTQPGPCAVVSFVDGLRFQLQCPAICVDKPRKM